MFLLTVNKVFTAFGLFRKTPQVSIAGCATIHIKHILQKIKSVIRRFNDGIRVNAHFPHA